MSWIWSALIGLVAGAVAKFIMPGKQGGGIIITMVLGVCGSLLMTFLGRMVGWYQEGEGGGFIAGTIGSLILLAGYGYYQKLQSKSSE